MVAHRYFATSELAKRLAELGLTVSNSSWVTGGATATMQMYLYGGRYHCSP